MKGTLPKAERYLQYTEMLKQVQHDIQRKGFVSLLSSRTRFGIPFFGFGRSSLLLRYPAPVKISQDNLVELLAKIVEIY